VHILDLPQIRATLVDSEIIAAMRDALIAQSDGECDTPMPMHLDIPGESAEIHIKSSYRSGGRFFALKIAGTFPGNLARGRSSSSGMMLLSSAETGEPVAFLADEGHLTDVRTAAVAAMVARELGRGDGALGILGTGIQARLQARMHAAVLPLERIVIWGRTPDRAAQCARELADLSDVSIAASPAAVARETRLIVTATPSRTSLLRVADIQPGTHISAVGSDSPGKQELDPDILRGASLLLADSLAQCAKLGELQHAPDQLPRALEIGAFCRNGRGLLTPADPGQATVADFTGLGIEDLYIAEYAYRRSLV
jgi:ornithine cyclodeaminase/alanine dehydrogenase-like protein (mu-crystallin family)